MNVTKYSAVIVKDNKLLIVRQKGQDYWKNVGGKLEEGETPEECLKREIIEELGTELKGTPTYFFSLPTTKAVSDPNILLDMHLYICQIVGQPTPSSEIEEVHWLSKKEFENRSFSLTHQLRDYIVPKLIGSDLVK